MELLERHFDSAFEASDGISKLRELILTLAMQGKLVPQDPNDPPARELLLKDLTLKIGSGSTPSGGKESYISAGIPLIRSMNVHFGRFKMDGLAFIDDRQAEKLNNVIVQELDVLLNITGASIGRVTVAPPEMANARVNQHVCIIRPNEKVIPRYLEAFLASPLIQRLIDECQVGATREALTKAMIEQFRIPVPSLNAQRRIVARIDELIARCDELEKLRGERDAQRIAMHTAAVRQLLNVADTEGHIQASEFLSQHFGLLYTVKENVAALRKAILQLAAMGKLIPQDPNDPPVSDLLKQIEAEKKRLVTEGKIREPKPLPMIAADETPYALPQGWTWVRFGDLAEFINGDRGKNYPNREEYVLEGIPWINTGHIEPDGTLTKREMYFITKDKFDSLNGGKIRPGDLVYCLRGATFGKTAIVDPYKEGAIASSLMIIRPFEPVFNRYMYHYLIGPTGRKQIFRFNNGSAQPNLSANSVRLYVFPLPPAGEQHRIVAKIDELMSLCDTLEERIDAASAMQSALLNAMMAHFGRQQCA